MWQAPQEVTPIRLLRSLPNVDAFMVVSASTIQFNRGSTMAVVVRVNCVKIQNVTKTRILSLNLFATATQRNDLAVLSYRFDRRPTTLIW